MAHIAATCGNLDLLKRLIALNSDVAKLRMERNSNLVTAAAIGGDLQTVKYLVDDLKLSFDEEDDDKSRPIMWAVQKKHKEVIAFLEERGARLEVMTQQGFNTLTEASRSGDVGAVHAALNSGFKIDGQTEDGQTALMVAVCAGHLAVVDFLLRQNASPKLHTQHGLTALHMAAWQNKEEPAIVELLIESGADKNAKDHEGDTPLHWAAHLGKTLVVKALLAQDVERDPTNDAGQTPILGAASFGHAKVVRELLRGGADVGKAEQNGWTALHFVADDGDQTTLHEMVLHLPTRDIINRRAGDGWTPLMLAARKGHAAIVRALIDLGADRQLLLRDGRDALAIAIKSLSAATVREILATSSLPFFLPSRKEAS